MAWFSKKPKQEEIKKEVPAEQAEPIKSAPTDHVVLAPHVTEKANLGNAKGTYVFKVSARANKIEIKRSIKKLYNATVIKVGIVHMPAKFRQVGKHSGEKSGYKKAVITLAHGQKL